MGLVRSAARSGELDQFRCTLSRRGCGILSDLESLLVIQSLPKHFRAAHFLIARRGTCSHCLVWPSSQYRRHRPPSGQDKGLTLSCFKMIRFRGNVSRGGAVFVYQRCLWRRPSRHASGKTEKNCMEQAAARGWRCGHRTSSGEWAASPAPPASADAAPQWLRPPAGGGVYWVVPSPSTGGST